MATVNLPLEVDLPGRVRNMRLAPSNALYSLYEAVVNAIHAVLDGPEKKNGQISIRILRGHGQHTTAGKLEPGTVIGFEVVDNGIGFNEDHFRSFRMSDSTVKAKYGGKGVGRLLWLKVFTSITITSTKRFFGIRTVIMASDGSDPGRNAWAGETRMASVVEQR